jgi:hypothetical protein
MTAAPPRHVPHFVFVPDRDGGDPGAPRWSWHFYSANHRRLGRGAGRFDSLEACRRAAVRIGGSVEELARSMSAGDRRNAWSWLLDREGTVLALSAHSYARRIECERALEHFVAAVRVADPDAGVVRVASPPRSFESIWGSA